MQCLHVFRSEFERTRLCARVADYPAQYDRTVVIRIRELSHLSEQIVPTLFRVCLQYQQRCAAMRCIVPVALGTALVFAASHVSGLTAVTGWRQGSASFYGGQPDGEPFKSREEAYILHDCIAV